MSWNIAQAKQRFSEVVKQAIKEPQVIYNRNQAVAVLIDADEFARYEQWKQAQAASGSLADDFAALRALLKDEGFADGLDIPPRRDRLNTFVEDLSADDLSG